MDNNTIIKSNQIYENPFSDSNVNFSSAQLLEKMEFVKKLNEKLSTIKGQDAIVQRIEEKMFDSAHENSNKPKVFFMVGAPGVGKTMAAIKIAEALQLEKKTYNCSEFVDPQIAGAVIEGTHPSFQKTSPGDTTLFVSEHPVSTLIFDEIEKAHPSVIQMLLSSIEEGSIFDNHYQKNFSIKNCTIIFTSNACKKLWDRSDRYVLSDTPVSSIINELKREIHPQLKLPVFSDAFISRISGNILFFNNLRPQTIKAIVSDAIKEQIKGAYDLDKLMYNVDVEALAELFILNGGNSAGLRTIVENVKAFFTRLKKDSAEVASELSSDGKLFDKINVDIFKEDASEDALRLLKTNHPARVLVSDKRLFEGKDIPKNVEFIVAESGMDARKVNALDISLAFLDARNTHSRQVFDAVMAQGDIPVYVYSDDERTARSDLSYFIDHGTTETATAKVDIAKWAIDILKNISFTYIVSTARRSSKIFNYDLDIRYDEDNYTVNVQLHNISTRIVQDPDEQSGFVADKDIPNVDFSDIIGAEDAKKELLQVAQYLLDYKKYKRAGVRIPKGILLHGEPGTGKTMLGKALASYCNLPFFVLKATDFLKKYVGEGVEKLQDAFERARRVAPAIIYIDEIDIIARSRMDEYSDNHHTDDLVNAFLPELDGFDTQNKPPVFVIAATNFDVTKGNTKLDEAFLRRFDKKIYVDLPSCDERIAYIKKEMSKIPNNIVTTEQISSIAKRAIAWSLADLNLVIQNAIRQYQYENGTIGLDNKSLIESFETFNDGSQKKHFDEKTLERIAYHEAGHAVLSCVLGFPTIHTTIISRSNYGGYVQSGDENKTLYTREELLDKLTVLLAGRASEYIFYKDVTTGASGDLKVATNLARKMICEYGMSDDGALLFIEESEISKLSEVREKENKLLKAQMERAQKLIEEYRGAVEKVAYELLQKNSLNEEELAVIMENYI